MGQDKSEGEILEDKVVKPQVFAGGKTIKGSQQCISNNVLVRSALTLIY